MNFREINRATQLYCSLRAEPGNSADLGSKLEFGSSDATHLLELAKNNGTVADLHALLAQSSLLGKFSIEQRHYIEAWTLAAELSHHKLIKEVKAIESALAGNDIPHVYLKGTALVLGGYCQTPGQRTFGDIDFVVDPSNLDACYKALLSYGFQPDLNPPLPLSEYWSAKHLPPLRRSDFPFPIELHQRPFESGWLHTTPLTTTDILEQARTVCSPAGRISIPCAEHLFISAFYHNQIFERCELEGRDHLKAMIDCLLIVEKEGTALNWDLIKQLVEKHNLEQSLALFGNRISAAVDKQAAKWPISQNHSWYREQRFALFSRYPTLPKLASVTFLHLREMFRVMSAAGKKQRRATARENPENWKFQPIYIQLSNPAMLRDRFNYFIDKFRS